MFDLVRSQLATRQFVTLPGMFTNPAYAVRATRNPPFDVIVVDEAQDFSDDYWFAVEELLRNSEDGPLYIFIDENQALYRRHGNLPVSDEPSHLTANCRNTAPLHRTEYDF